MYAGPRIERDAHGRGSSQGDAAPGLLWINHFAVSPGEGGGTRHFELGRELVRRGWRVTIGASDFHLHSRSYTKRDGRSDRSAVAERIDGVEFRWLWGAPYERNDWRRGWNWVSFSRSLLRWARRAPPADVVIGSSPHLFAALAAHRVARRWDVPFVFEVRDLWPESLLALGRGRDALYWLLDRIARHLYRSADRIIVLARGTGRHLADRGVDASRIVFVPNGVHVAAFDAPSARGDDEFTLVYAGAHGPANGLDVVLRAANVLRDQPRIRFVLVGDGPAKAELIEESRERGLENVEFRDPVPKEAIPGVLAGADAGLMVLRDASLFAYGVSPNKLFDYFAAGLPVVCNVPGEVAEMVTSAGAGDLAEPGSGMALARAVLRLADRPVDERLEMGRMAREWVARERGRPVLATRLDGALRSLIRGAGRDGG